MNIELIQLLSSNGFISLKALILLDLLMMAILWRLQVFGLLVLQAKTQLTGAFCSDSQPLLDISNLPDNVRY
nr:MAG TPA: hypothetical protein [Caudoviricetes sp.]